MSTATEPTNDLFSSYKLVVGDAQELRRQRDNLTLLFVNILTLLLGAQGYLFVFTPATNLIATLVLMLGSLFGLSFCWNWRKTNAGYKRLLNIRYFVLEQWENHLPEMQRYYTTESVFYSPNDPHTVLAKEYLKANFLKQQVAAIQGDVRLSDQDKTAAIEKAIKGLKVNIRPFSDIYGVLVRIGFIAFFVTLAFGLFRVSQYVALTFFQFHLLARHL